MNTAKIFKEVMKATKTTQAQLVERLGVGHQSAVSNRVNSANPTLLSTLEILEAMGYELVVQPKKRGRRPEGQLPIVREEEQ